MTPQEAIKNIEIAIAEVEWEYPMQYAIAFEIAIKALKYRIAKTVETIVSNEDVKLGAMTMKAGTKVFKCTNCNSYVSPSHKFCTNCGQALDWSDS